MARSTLMERKLYSLLVSGTIGTAIVSAALMSTTLIAGLLLGETAVLAVTLVSPLYSVGAFFSYIISVGLPILYPAAIGRADRKEADRIFGFSLLAAIVTGVLLFAALLLFGDLYLRSYGPDPEVLSLAGQYLVWIRFSLLVLPMVCVLNCAVYADGDAFVYNLAGFAQVGTNLLLSWLLCLRLGIAGISLGFFTALLVSLLLSCLHFPKKTSSLHPGLHFSRRIFRQMLQYGAIDAGTYLSQAAFTLILNYFVILFFGEPYLVMVSVISLLRQLQILLDGAGQGAMPILSVYRGEKNRAGMRLIYDRAERAAVVMGLSLTVLTFLLAFLTPRLLGITDPQIAAYASGGLRIAGLGSLFVSLVFYLTSYDLVIGHLRRGFLFSAMKDVLIAAPAAVLLAIPAGIPGLFAGLAAAPAAVWLINLLYRRKKYSRDPKLCPDVPENACKSRLFGLTVCPEDIVRVRDEAGDFLAAEGLGPKTVNHVMLLIEETFMMVLEKNPGRHVRGECSLILEPGKSVEIIARDDGMPDAPADIRTPEMDAAALRAHLVSSIVENLGVQRMNMNTLGFNRKRFVVEIEDRELLR